MTKKQKKSLIKIIVSAVLTASGILLGDYEIPRLLIALAAFLTVGYDVLIKAVRGIVRGQLFDENFLMGVASTGAFLCGDYTEAAAVLIFYAVGELFESYAVGKSRKNIAALLDITADRARVDSDGELKEIPAEEVTVGTVITVLPGDKIPVDGTVLEGETQIMTSALTGESRPKTVRPGDTVLSGCVNMTAAIKVETTKEFSDSAASKILELIEESAAKKSKSENFITKFSRVYTPVVCGLAVLLALVPPTVSMVSGNAPMWTEWLKRALTFLVISCPCALVVSVPMSFFGGISAVSRQGILIKGSSYLETLSKVNSVAFDKTGTLTEGSFEVVRIEAVDCDENTLMNLAAAAECYSTHPIALSILKRAETPDKSKIKNSKNLSGKGVSCEYEDKPLSAGSDLLMAECDIAVPKRESSAARVHIAYDGKYMGCIHISDSLKAESKTTVDKLKKRRIKTFMLTGDNKAVAEDFAKSLGVDGVKAELLPEDKLTQLESIMEESRDTIAFVGDGINDAPVLMRADVGIAMGALGSDAAIEAADVVIMDDNPARLIIAIDQAKRTMKIVRENIIFSIGVKFLFLLLGAVGVSNMWLSIFADVGVLIIAVLNAMRCMRRM